MQTISLSATRRRNQVVNIRRAAARIITKAAPATSVIAAVTTFALGAVYSVTPDIDTAYALGAAASIGILALITTILSPDTEKGGAR